MRFRYVAAPLVALLLVTGCGPGSGTSTPTAAAPAGGPSAPGQSQGPAASVEPAKTSGIWFEPAALSKCARPDKVMVHWDASSFNGVRAVDIIAVGKTGKEVLFLSAGRSGSRESGVWMSAGSQMILRNKADGTELARATVESIPCN
jgi:hypothetical protein